MNYIENAALRCRDVEFAIQSHTVANIDVQNICPPPLRYLDNRSSKYLDVDIWQRSRRLMISTLVCAGRQAMSQLPESTLQEASEIVWDMLSTSTAGEESMEPAPAVSVLQVCGRKAISEFVRRLVCFSPEILALPCRLSSEALLLVVVCETCTSRQCTQVTGASCRHQWLQACVALIERREQDNDVRCGACGRLFSRAQSTVPQKLYRDKDKPRRFLSTLYTNDSLSFDTCARYRFFRSMRL